MEREEVIHDSRGKWLGQYETEDAAVEMIREMAQDIGAVSYTHLSR